MRHRWHLSGLLLLFILSCNSPQIRVNVIFDSLHGLIKADRVLFDANEVGNVVSIQYNPDGRYTVTAAVDKGFAHAVTEYSQFRVIDDPGRAGHKAVEIHLSQLGGSPLAAGTTVTGDPGEADFGTQLHKELQQGLSFLVKIIDEIGRDVQKYPESQEYKLFQKSIEDLMAEIASKEKQAREKVKREWLPRIQRELDALREKLKQQGREQELAPIEREFERIQRI